MKTFGLFLFLFIPIIFFGQSLTGVWTGTLSNDSTTIRREQTFELALTQYKEKVYGYSRTSFIVNDTLYYVMKRIRGTVDGAVCEIKDDEVISYNFPGRLDKGVKVTTIFRMNKQDSTWQLSGDWSTNKTKRFYSISGKAELTQLKDLEKSKILPHLEELKLADDAAFYADTKKPTQEAVSPVKRQEETVKNKPADAPVKNSRKRDSATTTSPKKNDEIKKTPAASRPVVTEDVNPAITKQAPVVTPPVNATTALPIAAAHVNERKTLAPQIVNFKSDSLELALYDNGEIDGDTVSILLNGEIIMARQGLKASAIKKTIYIPANSDSVSLVLYAENLGKYPPNTGLLVVRDKGDVYQIRFSADLQQNAAIVFRRLKSE